MEDSPVAHNCAASPLEGAVMSQPEAQSLLASLIIKLSLVTVCYWWRLMGDEANSLCKFLDMFWRDLRLTLRKCGILCGPADSFKKVEFERWKDQMGCHYSTCRPSGKPVNYLKLGQNTEDACTVEKPKEMYSLGGVLEMVPILGIHCHGI